MVTKNNGTITRCFSAQNTRMIEFASLEQLTSFVEKEAFKGFDPYDALNSAILRGFSFRNKYLRIAFTQSVKRLPVNIRPLLRITKDYNPKGLGLFLWGHARLYKLLKFARDLRKIEFLLGKIEETKTICSAGHGWGYNFDWQSRAFFVPKFTPTVVNSSFIGHALLDTWDYTGRARARDMAIPIGDFIVRGLHYLEENDSLCLSYTSIDHYFVHNANLLGASLLIRLYKETGNEEFKKIALSALKYSMKHQRADGSWYYAERESSHWIDSFHTGFNLQAIKYFLDSGFAEEYRPQFEKGVLFYAENFFLADGTPKYYPHCIYPIDIHSPAQAVVFFSGMGEEYIGLTRRVLMWMIRNMQGSSGAFYFQKHRYYTNRLPYMRWGQAWAFNALTQYLFCHGTKEMTNVDTIN